MRLRFLARVALTALLLTRALGAEAHPLAPALLQLEENADGTIQVTWKTSLQRVPGARIEPALPRSCRAMTPPAPAREVNSVTARWTVRCGAGLVGQRVGVEGLGAGRVDALLRIGLADGRRVQRVLSADEPFLTIPEPRSRLDFFADYLDLGARHILTGPDHLLFVFGLLLLVSGLRPLIATVTAFTLGHSLTLALAALGLAVFPSRPIELAIALSVFVLAVELAREPSATLMRRYPWALALLFGLLHGLGFAGALAEVGLPEQEIPLTLLAFNVGIELGQLLFVVVVLALGWSLGRSALRPPAWARRVPVYAMGSLAAFCCLERSAALLP